MERSKLCRRGCALPLVAGDFGGAGDGVALEERRSLSPTRTRLWRNATAALSVLLWLVAAVAGAAPNLVLDTQPVTWNIIGLDSNNVNVGPQDFPVGVRVKNTGTMDATSVTATFAFTSANSLINLVYSDTVTTDVIPAGGYADFYFTVRVTRSAAAYFTTRNYSITVTGGGLVSPLITTDTLFVEKLISQQSNDVLSLVGPPTVSAGETRQFILTATTQNGGRDQVEQFVNFPNTIFQITNIQTTYSNPGVTINKFYADACGWIRNNLPPNNNSCNGPDMYGGQVGANITVVYTVYIKETPTTATQLTTLIMDVGGNSFHYNTDFGLNVLTVNPPADLSVVKTAVDNPVEAGSNAQYLLTVINPENATTAKDVVLSDSLPMGLTYVSATPTPTSGPNPLIWNIGDMAASSTKTFSVIVSTSCDKTGQLTNTAFVDSSTKDTNKANNTSSQTITVRDTTKPMVTCPANINLAADAGQCSRANVTFMATATDNCGMVTVTASPASGSTFPVGTTPVTVTATDKAGNTATCSFNVTITDSQPPLLTCPPTINASADAELCAASNVSITTPTATDNCTTKPVTLTATRSDSLALTAPYPVGTTTITWKATDSSNLMTTCAQLVVVKDMTAPKIVCPSNITVNAATGQCKSGPVTYSATATDNCSNVTVVLSPPSGSMFSVGTTEVTATATDTAGNVATCKFTVTVNDTQQPTIVCPPTINVNANPTGCSATSVTITQPFTSDNCSTTSLVGTRSDQLALNAPYPVGNTTITWKVTDASGQMAQCSQTVHVTDVTSPTILCPSTITVNADPGNCSAGNVVITPPITTDDCSTATLVGTRSDGLTLSQPYPVGTTVITWKVTDLAGNSATCTQNVIVLDVTKPTITCPATINVNVDPGSCSAARVTITTPTLVADNCSTLTIMGMRSDGLALNAPYPIGTTTITWTVKDSANNSASCDQLVVVKDNIKPGIICPATLDVNANPQLCAATDVTLVIPAGTDNCTSVTVAGVRGDMLSLSSPYPVGNTTIVWTVTDGSGNQTSCTQLVRVHDVTPPTITCPATITVNADPLNCSAGNVVITPPLTADNCSTTSLTGTRSDGLVLSASYPVGNTIITWKVSDAAGNMAQCTQLVVVLDVTPPTITCPATINVNVDPASCSAANVTITTPTLVADNCSTLTIMGMRSDNLALSAPYPIGTTTITWTVKDSANNSASCTQLVVVTDNIKPGIVCPTTIDVNANPQLCAATDVTITPPLTTDNCTTSALVGVRSDQLALGSPYPVGSTTIVWTVTDGSGNQTSCTQLVRVHDVTPPTIVCNADVTVNASAANCQAANVVLNPPLTNDNCSTTSLMGTRSDALALSEAYPLGTTTVTWKVTDASGNMTSCTQLVIVKDVTAPLINCPQVVNVTNTPGLCGATVNYTVTANDTCDGTSVTLVCDPAPGTFFPVGSTHVTCTATDAAGNTSTCGFNVVVTDTEKPTLACPVDIMTCMQDVVLGAPVTGDNCGTATLTVVRSDNLPLNADYPVGLTNVVYTLADIHGNMTSCTQHVLISDSVLPQVVCPADITVNALDGLCVSGPVDYPDVMTMDNCTTNPANLTITYSPPEGSTFALGENTVTVTVEDPMHNTAMCTFKIIVKDVAPPVLTCPGNITVGSQDGLCGSVVSYQVPAADACSNPVIVTAVPPSGSFFAVGTTPVTVTATDSANNSTSCTFSVTVLDNVAPAITCGPTISVMANTNECQASVTVVPPVTSDNCSTSTLVGVRSDMQQLTDPYPVGMTTITWKVTDSAGNMTSCTQTVKVNDTTKPTIACPPNIEVNAPEGLCLSGPVQYGAPVIGDNCTPPGMLTVTFVPPSGSTFPIGTSTVVATVTDPANNATSCTFTVTVKDVTPPNLVCPANITVNNTPGVCGASSVTYSALATDTCSGPATVTFNPPSGSSFPTGTTTVNVSASDTAGNVARCSFTVTVNDTEKPTITCPTALDVMADVNECQVANVNLGVPNTADNCGVTSVTGVRNDGKALNDPYPLGTTVVTWTVADAAGNTASCTQNVVVHDRTMPTIACPANIEVNALEGQCQSGPVQYAAPVVGDNCTSSNLLTVTFVPPSGSTFPIGTTNVVATVTDPSNNSTSCTFTVTVKDVTPPNLVCPANITVSNSPGVCGANSVTYSAVATDGCSNSVVVTFDPPSGSSFPGGTTTVNVTATDAAGNVARCSFTVTVNDTEKPTITCPPAVDVMADVDQCQVANVNLGTPTTGDNCGVASVVGTRSDGLALSAPYPVGNTVVTWKVTDSAGNMAQCTQNVMVHDRMAPTIACPANIEVSALTGQCISGPVEYGAAIVSDNCSTGPETLPVVFTPPSGSTFPIGVTTVTASVTDAGMNSTSCTFTVTVKDVTPPSINCPSNITVSNSPGQCGASQVNFSVTASDSCSLPVMVSTVPASGTAFPVGTTTVVATAKDAAGNTATCSFTVTVVDSQPPTITCPANLTVNTSPGVCEATNVTYQATATDNCLGPVTITYNPPSGSTFPVGVNVVQVTATDGAGNSSSCSFNVTVQDKDAPRISCPNDITTATVPCELDAVVPLTPPSVLDPCGTPAVSGVRSDGKLLTDRFPVGDTTVVWTATDPNNNQSSCSQLIHVELSQCQPVCDGPDLVIMPKMFPTYKCSKAPTCKVKGWYVVTNIGTQPSGETTVCFYLSDDEVLDPGDFKFKPTKHHRVKALQPGEMTGVDLNGKAPKGVPVEGKYIIAVVDCGNLVEECREDNNQTADHPMPPMKKMK